MKRKWWQKKNEEEKKKECVFFYLKSRMGYPQISNVEVHSRTHFGYRNKLEVLKNGTQKEGKPSL